MTGKDVTYRKQDLKYLFFFFYIYANYMSENVVFMILISETMCVWKEYESSNG